MLSCKCNRNFYEHDEEIRNEYTSGKFTAKCSEWNYASHVTNNEFTDAYGEILFLGVDYTSKYVKVSAIHTKEKQILDLLFMKACWNLKKPKLIISKLKAYN